MCNRLSYDRPALLSLIIYICSGLEILNWNGFSTFGLDAEWVKKCMMPGKSELLVGKREILTKQCTVTGIGLSWGGGNERSPPRYISTDNIPGSNHVEGVQCLY